MVRFVCSPRVAAVVCVLGLSASAVAAQEQPEGSLSAPLLAAGQLAAAPFPQPPIRAAQGPLAREQAKRPGALVPLYVSYAGLQALDIHSTYRALASSRAREANPMVRGVIGHPAVFMAAKLAATGTFIFASERMWKKHRTAALLFVAAGNCAMTAIVAHNYRVPRQ